MYKFLFIMDPLENIIPTKDTTYILMLEAESRGNEIFFTLQDDLFIKNNQVKLKNVYKVDMIDQNNIKNNMSVCEIKKTYNDKELDYFDVIFMRKDPPVDDKYIKTTYMLEMVKDNVLVVNNPTALRAFNEKLSTLRFDKIIPNTKSVTVVIKIQ